MAKVFVTGGSGFVGRELIKTLVDAGDVVAALARSPQAADVVRSLGAQVVTGDLSSKPEMKIGMAGAAVVFHCAADVSMWGDVKKIARVNVEGTRNVIECARDVGVPRVVHVSTEAVLVSGKPLVQMDETAPLPARNIGVYPATKAAAERVVRAMNGHGIECVIVRPRFIWGRGDTTVLPGMIDASKRGGFPFIGGGDHLTSTCHVLNVIEGMLLAADRGKPGETYFLTDGPAVTVRGFVTDLLATQGVKAGAQNIPYWLALFLAHGMELFWKMAKYQGTPPLTRAMVELFGREVTVNDAKARRELGYRAQVSHEAGLADMRTSASL
jgi:nucleoside-diphosphate-sugar epimerase